MEVTAPGLAGSVLEVQEKQFLTPVAVYYKT